MKLERDIERPWYLFHSEQKIVIDDEEEGKNQLVVYLSNLHLRLHERMTLCCCCEFLDL